MPKNLKEGESGGLIVELLAYLSSIKLMLICWPR